MNKQMLPCGHEMMVPQGYPLPQCCPQCMLAEEEKKEIVTRIEYEVTFSGWYIDEDTGKRIEDTMTCVLKKEPTVEYLEKIYEAHHGIKILKVRPIEKRYIRSNVEE